MVLLQAAAEEWRFQEWKLPQAGEKGGGLARWPARTFGVPTNTDEAPSMYQPFIRQTISPDLESRTTACIRSLEAFQDEGLEDEGVSVSLSCPLGLGLWDRLWDMLYSATKEG